MKLYMRVSADDLELPEAVAETQVELAEMCGVAVNTIARSLHFVRKGVYKNSIYKEVEVDDD